MSIDDVRLVELPRFNDPRGNLSFVEECNQIPFKIARTYWIYDVPGGKDREGHAFRVTNEFIIAISGSFDVTVDDGTSKEKYSLNRSYYGLYIPKGLWRTIDNFSTNALALEFADTRYNPEDYVEDYHEYINLKGHGKI